VQQSQRLRYGRFYTQSRVASLALALCEPRAGELIWDPACGDGVFLRTARDAGHNPSRLYGCDIDEHAIASCAQELPKAQLRIADLFVLKPDEVGPFELIVGNPPYVRNERLPAARRAQLQATMRSVLGFEPPAQCDLSLLALVQALRFLAPGGRLAFVMPNTWMDASFARAIRPWLLRNFSLRAIVESRGDAWFPEASVNTVIVVFEAPGPEPIDKPCCFAQLLGATEPSFAANILAPDSPEDSMLRRSWVDTERLSTSIGGQQLSRWSSLLRAPSIYFDILESAGHNLVRLGDTEHVLLRKGYGTKVGVSAFFSPRKADQFKRFSVEEAYLRPFVRSLRGIHRYVLKSEDVQGRIFVCEEKQLSASASPGALSYIHWGEQQTKGATPWSQVPSVRGNKPWYQLPELRTGDVILPQFRMDRHYILSNPERLPVNNSAWWGQWLNPAHREVGIALLNCTWLALSTETVGRVNLGEGLLTCYGPELDDIHIPNPDLFVGTPAGTRLMTAWKELSRRAVLPLRQEIEKGDRNELDAAVLDGLGLNAALLRPLQLAASSLLEQRLRLASNLHASRQKLRTKQSSS
jgi:SAM-dependent methyltransferase